MATQSPLSFLPEPPQWAVLEAQRRVVLVLNHVLMQEPEALARLTRQNGRTVLVNWRQFKIRLAITPAGLLELAEPSATPDLTLALVQESPMDLLQNVLRGNKPDVRIEGDVQLAAEVNWLVEYVRWDIEEDLAKFLGDAPAHALGQAFGWAAQALRRFAGGGSP